MSNLNEILQSQFASHILEISKKEAFEFVLVKATKVLDILAFCKDNETIKMDFLMDLFVVEEQENFTVIYQLFSTITSKRANIKVHLNKKNPKIQSCTKIWSVSEYYELEIAEMFGFEVDGHPNLRRLLLPDQWEGFPMRKNYEYPKIFNEVDHVRPTLRKEHPVP